MLLRIKKGWHRTSFPFQIPWPTFKRKVVRLFIFDSSYRYDIGKDQTDIHKIFGAGLLPPLSKIFKKWHHQDSCRVGGRYNPATDKVDLFAYAYVNGVSNHLPDTEVLICSVDIDDVNEGSIEIRRAFYLAEVNGVQVLIPKYRHTRLRYTLTFSFGGDIAAPHDITFNIFKL